MAGFEKLLEAVSTSILSDALEMVGVRGQCNGLFSPAAGVRVFGRAFTVRISPHNPKSTVHDEYMEDLRPGDVVMLDGRGVEGALWGDLRSIVAQRLGAVGTVVEGAARDGDACLKMGYPVFSRSRSPLSGGGRAWIEAKQVPVVIGGVWVEPGDLIFGDGDGVVVLPAMREQEILAKAEALEAADSKMTAALREGMPLAEARRQFGVKKTLPAKT